MYEVKLRGIAEALVAAKKRGIEGEGVVGFGRAFLGAGARSTVSTLWRVGDQSTAAFMT